MGKQMSQSLLSACGDGSPAVVERLLRTDCDAACSIDVPAPDGTTPLLATIMWGHFDALCVLLEFGADANMPFDGTRWSPLHAAAVQESPKMCQILLERGADPMLEDEHQRRPVDYASAASEEVWSHFEERGCERSSKEELVAKSIIKKVPQEERAEMAHSSKVAVTRSPLLWTRNPLLWNLNPRQWNLNLHPHLWHSKSETKERVKFDQPHWSTTRDQGRRMQSTTRAQVLCHHRHQLGPDVP